MISPYNKRYSASFFRAPLTADPDEISTRRGRAESGREDEKRHDLSRTGAERRPHQRRTERRSTPRATETAPRDSPRAACISAPPTLSAITAPHKHPAGTAHDTTRPTSRPKHCTADSFGTFRPRYLSRTRAPRQLAAHILH